MTTPVIDNQGLEDFGQLKVPNANRTSGKVSEAALEAYAAKLDELDDMAIALELRARPKLVGDVVELDDFIRQQGYEPADLGD